MIRVLHCSCGILVLITMALHSDQAEPPAIMIPFVGLVALSACGICKCYAASLLEQFCHHYEVPASRSKHACHM